MCKSHYRFLTVLLYCFGLFSGQNQNDECFDIPVDIVEHGISFNSKNGKYSETSLSQQDKTIGLSESDSNASFRDNGSDIIDLDSDYALLVQSGFANLNTKLEDTELIKKRKVQTPFKLLISLREKLQKNKKNISFCSESEPFVE